MEEAVTDTIIKGAAQRIDSFNSQLQESQHNAMSQSIASNPNMVPNGDSGVVNVDSYVKK